MKNLRSTTLAMVAVCLLIAMPLSPEGKKAGVLIEHELLVTVRSQVSAISSQARTESGLFDVVVDCRHYDREALPAKAAAAWSWISERSGRKTDTTV